MDENQVVLSFISSDIDTAQGVSTDLANPAELIPNASNLVKDNDIIYDATPGFRVIIMTEANSSVKSKVLKLLPKLKTEETDGLCVA